ncbi:MAG: hypothetical protein AW12_01192 [Candidatus Accumulibacter sp. BA-94]|uniref:YqjK family protein n=1 Tax=Accumulibacter sp. TaxID=2053492 RepID=UPI000448EC94|nr:YqjK family protein [Accumulibacter sp.]EXI91620.1 MAG: hypothetical protein AW12_01192 [Candidatus Accumulibacter sp. BA-94]MBL8391917.1 hypothetical protein [Accumulibacter sp.]HRD87230.1 YqjK family protein [Accumulibacter sp.]
MNQEQIDLAVERGRLLERISSQRQLLAQQLQPLGGAMATADRVVVGARECGDYLARHPELVATSVAVLVILRPSRVWRWTRRGFLAWRTWRMLRRELSHLGLFDRA